MSSAFLKPCGPDSTYPPSFVTVNNSPILKTSYTLEYGTSYGLVDILFCLVAHKSLVVTSNFTFRYRNLTDGSLLDFDNVVQKPLGEDYFMFSGQFEWNTYNRPSIKNFEVGVGDPDQSASFKALQRFSLYCFPK